VVGVSRSTTMTDLTWSS